MKKLLGTFLILISTLFIGHSQQYNNGSDDVYYNGSDDQPVNQPNDQQNYDDENNNDPNGAPTYQTFYDQLGPYGSWVNYPGYGYVWVPNQVDPNFSPYMTNGHWVYTDLGWTWVSDYAWGWGPFHYGRWFEDPSYGWMWMPGYDWAPAWVIWGDYNGYYGWACLGPHDVLSPHYRPDPGHWHFIEHQYMGRPDFGNHIVHSDVVAHNINEINSHVNIISHANTYNQSVFFAGPRASEVQKYSGQRVEAAKINNVHDATQTRVTGNQVNIYRPNITRTNAQPVPNKINNTQDLHQQNRSNNNNAQPIQQQNRPNNNAQPMQQQHNNPTPERLQPTQNTWTPPRQSTPRQFNNTPSQPVQRSFVPTEQPMQHYSDPQQQQHFSAPPQQHFSAPSAPRGGGGGRR